MTRIAKRIYPRGVVCELFDADGRLVLVQHTPNVRIDPIWLQDDEYERVLKSFGL